MKKILFCTLAGSFCFLISCNDSGTSGSDNSQNAKNLENNRKVVKAIETGDAAVIDSFITSDAIDHQGPNGTDVKGTDSVRHMLIEMHNHVSDLKFDIIADAANGDKIFCLSTMTGTLKDGSWGLPAGTKLNEKGVDIIQFNKDGKMTEHWGFVDPNTMMKHMQEMQGGKMENKMEEKKDTSKKM